MRHALPAIAAFTVLGSLAFGAPPAQFFGSYANAPIRRTPTTTAHITVPDGAPINSVRVVVKLRYPYDSDLDIVLVHGDTYVRLSSENGQMGQDFQSTRFSDTAPRAISDGVPPFTGTFRPDGGVLVPMSADVPLPEHAGVSLSTFLGQNPGGDWMLWIDDTAADGSGTLDYWSLEFNGAVDPMGPPMEVGPLPPGTWTEQEDAGALLGSAQVTVGHGALRMITGSLETGDTDLYQIEICDPANFSATTVGGAYFDTRLFLFDSAGNGVAFNDEEPGPTSQSVLSSTFVPSDGIYYLAVTASGRTAVDAMGTKIWLDEPAVAERRPDGPGGAHTLAGWAGSPAGGDYRIALTGVCFAARPCASADYNGDGDNGTDQDILDFFACLEGDCCPTCPPPDIDGDGDVGTDADIAAFFRAFSGGGC
jgi:subtilisin-like proprotein convertase family protein